MILKNIKKLFGKKQPEPKKRRVKKSAKDIATQNKEPWVSVLSVELAPDDVGNGAFELDWNEIFVAKLVKAGYSGNTDADIVDRWFQDVCRHVVLESYEKEAADTANRDNV